MPSIIASGGSSEITLESLAVIFSPFASLFVTMYSWPFVGAWPASLSIFNCCLAWLTPIWFCSANLASCICFLLFLASSSVIFPSASCLLTSIVLFTAARFTSLLLFILGFLIIESSTSKTLTPFLELKVKTTCRSHNTSLYFS
jgi:hypothetical protein